MTVQPLQGKLVRLGAFDMKRDVESFAQWSTDSEYLLLMDADPARPWSARHVREEIEKTELKESELLFAIRTLADDRAIGSIGLDGIQWENASAWAGIGIGDREYWDKGYGTDAMQVLLHYAFTELGLYRVSLDVFEYNPRAIRSYEKAGFVVEGRCRQFLHREGRRWDLIYMAILRPEWEKMHNEHQV